MQELEALTGQRTVPNVFIGGKHLGGYDGESERVAFSLFDFGLIMHLQTLRKRRRVVPSSKCY